MTRDEALERLPFHVNGTLDPAEAAELAVWLDTDEGVRAEADALAALRSRMQGEPVGSPGAAGLERLMRAVDRAEPANRPAPPRMWQIAAAVLLAVALVQGLFLLDRGGDDGFRLAGADEAVFRVTFDPDATEAAIRAALLEAGVTIVDGPSSIGLYDLAPLEGVDPAEAERMLRQAAAVESVQGAAAE
ncbi:hypothetical protein P6F26_02835 [Roseibacterium sp. SDUM158017]|uniref:anti-sigma factor family protein n=1 Tax=Roseicyclus salinarum TaxID=3036773 RepID=UPI00241568B9|nr:hypothetical protein [Roseibacterium sp. SDUM158017]MDG4647367.1 hypothetical protein [Roseibacterium sp. SDUM158017]